jgi:hypothetical protein
MRSVLGTHEDNNFSTPIPNLPHFAFVYLAVLAGFLLSLLITAVFPPAGEQATLTGQDSACGLFVLERMVVAKDYGALRFHLGHLFRQQLLGK